MTHADLDPLLNPETDFIGGANIFDEVAVPVPPGSKAPPRPPGRERIPNPNPYVPPTITIIECQSIPIPPGTIAPPRKPSPDA